jgi:Antibiotic biosynthesis monooxygenase.
VIERHLTFSVHPDKTAAFEQFFAEVYRPRMSESPGFVRVELLREQEHPTSYAMVLRWADPESAVGWRTSEAHAALLPDLSALHSGMEVLGYDVIG